MNKERITCRYCQHQGIVALARLLVGQDAVTIKPNMVRYGCGNGHKFAIPESEAAK